MAGHGDNSSSGRIRIKVEGVEERLNIYIPERLHKHIRYGTANFDIDQQRRTYVVAMTKRAILWTERTTLFTIKHQV